VKWGSYFSLNLSNFLLNVNLKNMFLNTIIRGSGSFMPEDRVKNVRFIENEFYHSNGERVEKKTSAILNKFTEITGIRERRYASPEHNTSDLASFAGRAAIEDAGIDQETLDYIIVAHNWGDVPAAPYNFDPVPNIAARVKHKLGIKNSNCVAYDILFGCPGWVLGVIQAHAFIQTGGARRVLVIGSEAVSRVTDPHDIDCMLFGDGAGATVLEGVESPEKAGVLAYKTVSDCGEELSYLAMGPTYHHPARLNGREDSIYLKMEGRKVYRYSIEKMPPLLDECIRMAGVDLEEVAKVLLHQANGKMIRLIVQRLLEAHGRKDFDESLLPTNVEVMGNSSVATIPTLYTQIRKGEIEGHSVNSGDVLLFASMGAGMHANCVAYREP
jgi:3-oxoacyl-[acyl-carrier-protein] synthase III